MQPCVPCSHHMLQLHEDSIDMTSYMFGHKMCKKPKTRTYHARLDAAASRLKHGACYPLDSSMALAQPCLGCCRRHCAHTLRHIISSLSSCSTGFTDTVQLAPLCLVHLSNAEIDLALNAEQAVPNNGHRCRATHDQLERLSCSSGNHLFCCCSTCCKRSVAQCWVLIVLDCAM